MRNRTDDYFYNSLILTCFKQINRMLNYSHKHEMIQIRKELKNDVSEIVNKKLDPYNFSIELKEVICKSKYNKLYNDTYQVRKKQKSKIYKAFSNYEKSRKDELSHTKLVVFVNNKLKYISYISDSEENDIFAKLILDEYGSKKATIKRWWLDKVEIDVNDQKKNEEIRLFLIPQIYKWYIGEKELIKK